MRLQGPTNVFHCLDLSLFCLCFLCISALMELQQEDKVVSKCFSVFLGIMPSILLLKCCKVTFDVCSYTHTAANNHS